MKRQASRETLERLAEAADKHAALCRDADGGDRIKYQDNELGSALREVDSALAAYRAETTPLRTRAEVDAALAAVCREGRGDWIARVQVLVQEPTQDSGPSSDDRVPSAMPAGADLSDSNDTGVIRLFDCPVHPNRPVEGCATCAEEAEACSCEEAEGLKKELERVLNHVILIAGSSYRVRDLVQVRQLVLEALK